MGADVQNERTFDGAYFVLQKIVLSLVNNFPQDGHVYAPKSKRVGAILSGSLGFLAKAGCAAKEGRPGRGSPKYHLASGIAG